MKITAIRLIITLAISISCDITVLAYHNMSSYAWCAGNPVAYVDPRGMQPVKYVDMKGQKHINWSIVIMTKALKQNASDNQIEKHESYKKELASQLLNELSHYLNGDGNGVKTSDGEHVKSHFDIHVVDVKDTEDKVKAEELSRQYAQEIKDHQPGKHGKAAVFMECSTNGAFGLNSKSTLITISPLAPAGTKAHEVFHNTGIPDNGYLSGGILASPPEPITSKEVDEMWNIIPESNEKDIDSNSVSLCVHLWILPKCPKVFGFHF